MGKPVRVLCVNGESDPAETGSFIEMHRKGIDVTVITWPDTANYEALKAAGVPVIPYRLSWKLSLAGICFMRAELKRKRYDILHMLDKRATMNGLFASIGLNLKLIAYRGIIGNLAYWSPQSWLYLLNPRIDRIICVCDAIRQYLLSLGMPGLRLGRNVPVTIRKGHSPALYDGAAEDLGQFGIPDDAFVIACTARGIPRKGIPVFLNAIDGLPPGLNIHVLLAGTNMDNELHQGLVAQNSYSENIHLFGFLPRMPWILKGVHVSVLPSLKREGLPRAMLEAMLAGAVPVVTNSGGSPELVVAGESGFVVEPGDAEAIREKVLDLYNDRDMHGRMSAAARTRVLTEFTIEKTADETIAVYQELLSI
ncbi:MAG: glycosyltransferase family 4 protein [Gammaproteobacteria bacterium]|nr:glycosyltransferase family 4 protein [Gammaproteobacteria bacterium]